MTLMLRCMAKPGLEASNALPPALRGLGFAKAPQGEE